MPPCCGRRGAQAFVEATFEKQESERQIGYEDQGGEAKTWLDAVRRLDSIPC